MRDGRLLSLFAILLLVASPALAQRGKIAGTVTDGATGETLPGVNILLVETLQELIG